MLFPRSLWPACGLVSGLFLLLAAGLAPGCVAGVGAGDRADGQGGGDAGGTGADAPDNGGGQSGLGGAAGEEASGGTGGTAGANTGGAESGGAGGVGGNPRGGAGGAVNTGGGGTPGAGGMVAPGAIAIVAVGYSGRRVVSLDLGKTWIGDQKLGGSGDDEYLLRDGTAAKGRMVAVGWKFLSSTDGKVWTEHKNPHGQWQGGVAFGNGIFLASGGLGNSARSTDGVTWEKAANAGNQHIRRVVFDGTKFWANGDSGTVYSTTDGRAWTTGGSFPAINDSVGNVQVKMGGAGFLISEDGGKTWRPGVGGGGLAGVGVGAL